MQRSSKGSHFGRNLSLILVALVLAGFECFALSRWASQRLLAKSMDQVLATSMGEGESLDQVQVIDHQTQEGKLIKEMKPKDLTQDQEAFWQDQVTEFLEETSSQKTGDLEVVQAYVSPQLGGVQDMQVIRSSYDKKGTSYQLQSQDSLGSLLEEEDFAWEDLLIHPQAFQNHLVQLIYQDQESDLSSSQLASLSDQMLEQKWQTWPVKLLENGLRMTLPAGLGLGDHVDLPYRQLYPYLDGQSLEGALKTDYLAYQKETEQREKKRVALTFDDGPDPNYTPQVLDILKKYGARATFFVLGPRIQGQEAVLQRTIREGHQVGNHSWSHKVFSKLHPDNMVADLALTQEAIVQATGGYQATIFRPPYGDFNHAVQTWVPYPMINWSVDSLDWKIKDGPSIAQKVSQEVEEDSVILMHDIHPTTVEALEPVLEYLSQEGYEFVTIEELYQFDFQNGAVYFNPTTITKNW